MKIIEEIKKELFQQKRLILLSSGLLCFVVSITSAAEWNQWRGAKRDGVWTENGIIESFAKSVLEPIWSVPIGGGYNGPTVADNRVYLMDKITKPSEKERVRCFDVKTGKELWNYSYTTKYDIDYAYGPRASVTIARQV